MKKKRSDGVRETIKTVLYAVVIALIVRTLAYEPFNIPSTSMVPTLLVGDYLFVSKYAYGYSRHSLPVSLPLLRGRLFFSQPERGDIAVFKLPRDDKTDYIKRIIGLPGDRIQLAQGVLHVNGEPVERRRIEDYLADDGRRGAAQYIETLPNGRSHRIVEMSDFGRLDNTGIYTVPEGYYFAMGDNRDNSLDSRVLSEVGYIPAENLVGRAEFLFFSHNGSARLWQIWRWPLAVRYGRMFQAIEP
jgi:signal peptidase I